MGRKTWRQRKNSWLAERTPQRPRPDVIIAVTIAIYRPADPARVFVAARKEAQRYDWIKRLTIAGLRMIGGRNWQEIHADTGIPKLTIKRHWLRWKQVIPPTWRDDWIFTLSDACVMYERDRIGFSKSYATLATRVDWLMCLCLIEDGCSTWRLNNSFDSTFKIPRE